MALPLKASSYRYVFEDESGYRFEVFVTQDVEFCAWHATVTMSTMGHVTAEGAVYHMEGAAKAFLRMLEESRK